MKEEVDALTAAIMPSSRRSRTEKVSHDDVINEDKERRRVVVIEEGDGVPKQVGYESKRGDSPPKRQTILKNRVQ